MRKTALLVFAALFFLPAIVCASNIDLNNYSYDPAPAQPGKQITVWATIKNTSNYYADNVSAELLPSYPFSVVPGQNAVVSVGKLGAYQSMQLTFNVLVAQNVVDGNYGLEIKMTDGTEGVKIARMVLRVLVKNPRVELVKSSQTSASPGQELPIELFVRNIGGSNAKNIVVKIKEDRTVTSTGVVVEREIIPLGASAALVLSLKPDEEASVQMLLGINKDATLKNYSVPVTVEYYDENGTAFSSTGYIGLNVIANPEIDAVINSVLPLAYPSGTSEIGIDVFNIGAASASYVVAELSLENAEFSESKIFIGTLDPDDFDSFKTKAKISDKAKPGTYNLELRLSFKDENNETKTIQKSLPIKIVTAAEAQATGASPLIAVVGIIGLVLQLVGLYVVAKWLYHKIRKGSKK